MMRLTRLLALLFLFVGPALAQETPRPLDPALRDALEDLAQRNPGEAATVRQALETNRAEALARLKEHAGYLRELADAERSDPEKHALLIEQERMEREMRALLTRDQARPEDHAAHLEEMRAHLDAWFDVRQALRSRQVQAVQAELDANRARLSEASSEAELADWLSRVTEGGPGAMRARMGALAEPNELEVLAPALVQEVMTVDPARGEELARLVETSPAEFRAAMRALLSEHPEWEREARRRRATELRLSGELRAAIRAAHERLLPVVEARGLPLELTALPPEARGSLAAVLSAQRAIATRQLAEVEANLQRQRSILARRLEKKALIVELQLARFTGDDVYEW